MLQAEQGGECLERAVRAQEGCLGGREEGDPPDEEAGGPGRPGGALLAV